ncbi:MAG: type II toxin-antitoxin system PemK/MazF family toxin [Nitrospirae bacterium]|nr:type II toxin-antitoxin system PemK/MazF family toxin [Nitrospirota bacterium]
MEIRQYEVYLICLEPTIGHEIKKTRPCVVISPDEMNKHIQTVIIAPMTTKSHTYPSRVKTTFQGKESWVVLDQIRTVDKQRLVKKLGVLSGKAILQIKDIIREMLVD